MCRETVHIIVRAVELEGITWITYNRPVHASAIIYIALAGVENGKFHT